MKLYLSWLKSSLYFFLNIYFFLCCQFYWTPIDDFTAVLEYLHLLLDFCIFSIGYISILWALIPTFEMFCFELFEKWFLILWFYIPEIKGSICIIIYLLFQVCFLKSKLFCLFSFISSDFFMILILLFWLDYFEYFFLLCLWIFLKGDILTLVWSTGYDKKKSQTNNDSKDEEYFYQFEFNSGIFFTLSWDQSFKILNLFF